MTLGNCVHGLAIQGLLDIYQRADKEVVINKLFDIY
jgi:hypothetical protein